MKKYIYRGIICSTIAVFVYFLARYSVNFPYFDDYYAVLKRLIDHTQLHSRSQKFVHFFSLANEHRIGWNHFVEYAQYKIAGVVNFKTLIYIGNLSLFFVLLFFRKAIKMSNKLFLFTVSVLLLINLRYAESSFFAMASLENLRFAVFALRAIYFGSKKDILSFILSLAISFFGLFTQGNGILILPVLIIMHIIARRGKYAWISIFTFLVSIILYFHNYHGPVGLGSPLDNLITFIIHPSYRLMPFAILGNMLGVPANYYFYDVLTAYSIPLRSMYIPSIILGISMSAYICHIFFKKRYYKTNIMITGLFIFLILNSLLITISRLLIGYDGVMTSRYTIYSLLLLVMIIISFYEIYGGVLSKPLYKRIGILLFVGSFVVNIVFTGFIHQFWLKPNSSMRIETVETYKSSGKLVNNMNVNVSTSLKETVIDMRSGEYIIYKKILDAAIQSGYYVIPK